jgi:hypothetical protein
MRDFLSARRVVEMATLCLCFSAYHGVTHGLLSEMDIVVVIVVDKMSSVTPVRIIRITVGIRIIRIVGAILL